MKTEQDLDTQYEEQKTKLLEKYTATLEKKKNLDKAEQEYKKNLNALFEKYKKERMALIKRK